MKNEEKTLNSNSNNKNWMNIEQIGRLCGVIVVYGLALDVTHFCGYFHLSHFWTRRERYFTSGTSEQKSYLNFTWIEKFSAKWIIWSSFCLFVSFDFRFISLTENTEFLLSQAMWYVFVCSPSQYGFEKTENMGSNRIFFFVKQQGK